MIRALLLASTALLTLAAPVSAEQRSAIKAVQDTHIRVVPYSATKRTEIVGLLGQPTTVTFPGGENIYRVTQTKRIGTDGNPVDAAWETNDPKEIKDSPLGNNLTLWPMTVGTTIMNVTTLVQSTCKTDRPESCTQKSYPFRLVAKPDPTGMPDDPDAVFNIIFKGGTPSIAPSPEPVRTVAAAADIISDAPPPTPKKTTARRKRTAAQEQNEAELAADRLRTDSFNSADGCHYHGQGDAHSAIVPLCPLDNGIWTLMRFPGLSVKPAIYIGACDGHNERLARQHGTGDFIVVEEIAASFCLRLSPYALNIVNDAYRPAGTPTNSGTIAPTVDRKILHESTQ